MATFTTTSRISPTFIRGARTAPQPVGTEGQALSDKIIQVGRSIRDIETIKILIQSLEEESKKREEELKYYISSLLDEADSTNESEFTVFVINYSWEVWRKLRNCFAERDLCLEVPDACPGQNDNFMYTWSKSEHYLECEIFGNGAVEFFYRNRKSGEVWGEDTTLEHGFSATVLEKAALFAW